jgi:hypothetical protein
MDFTLAKFDELAILMVPTISAHAHSTSEVLISFLGFGFFFVCTLFFHLAFGLRAF